jgi:PAS domain S-box-containing protein
VDEPCSEMKGQTDLMPIQPTSDGQLACQPTWNENARLAALEQYAIVDSGREPGFDDIAELAADILDAPIAVVNFIAADRQWFKAEKGIGQDSLPLDVSICRYAILQPGVFVVPDLTQDVRFAGNPLVQAAGGLRFYAGALLETPNGLPLGTVCVLDTKARPEGINERQKRALRALAGQTMAQLELRRSSASARLDHERLAAMFAQATVGMSEISLDGRFLTVNERLCELIGRSREELLALSFDDITHKEDLAGNLPKFARLAETGESFTLDKRYVRPDGTMVWASSSVTRLLDAAGRLRGALAVTADITARKAEERRRALLLELSDQMRRLADPQEVVATATRRLGEELGATRVLYAEIDETQGRATVRGSWTDGTAGHLPSDISLGDFGATLIERLRSGGTLRVDDSSADPYTAGSLAALEAICARAIVSVPLFRGGRFVVNLNVHQRSPRAWTDAEVELIEAVAERTWEAVERARTEAALRASNGRFRAAIDAIEGVLWTNDAAGRMAGDQPGWAALTGQSLEEYEGYGWTAAVHPDDAHPTLKAWNAAVASRTTFMFEHRVKRRDGAWRLFSVRAIPTFGADGAISEWVGVHTDVTEQRAAEAALRASEARLKAVIEAAPVGLVFADATGRITGGNTHVERILGHPVLPSENVAEYRDWVSFHPDGRQVEGHEYPLARALAGEERPEMEALYQRGDGRKAWVRFIAAAKRDAEGHITGGVVASLDIDAQRRAQEDLQRLNQTLEQRVLETAAERERAWRVSQELLAVVEEDGTFAEINAAWTALGWAPEELLGQPFGSFTHPDDLEETQAKFASIFEAPLTVPYEYRFRAKDGGYLWFSWTATFEHGRVYASGRNVSAERQQRAELEAAETARREADALYRAYFENTPEALFVVGIDDNGDFRVEEINPAHEAGVGLKIEDIRDRRIQDILPAGVANQVLKTYRHVVETGALYQYRELFDLSGDPQHWDTSLVPVRDADGRITRLIGASRNVTRQVVAEEALRQSQKMEAMGQLTGGVAHDFNNLLTPIVGGLDMLQRKGLGGEREQRIIAGAMQSAERAKTLVQRLLAFARRQPLQAIAVDVAKLVEGMGELVSSTTGPQIKVVVEAPDDLPPAKADPNQLEMALLNLAVNARDAMPEGGSLRISAGEERIGPDHRSKLRPGAYIRLSVADTGAGMDDATLARAVEPFFSTKGIGKGTGLGLSMVHGLASQLGGALTIRSRPGLGTNVELWLPLSAEALEVPGATPEKLAEARARGTVLLVDDEELVRMSTADMLSDLGYSVVEAASGEEAVRLISRGERFDVLVTDHLMPGMTGTDLADTVRAAKPGVPVLLVSGYAEHEGIAPGLPRLTKPFRADELAARLSELIST